MLRGGLTASLRGPDLREARMTAVTVPEVFGVAGPLVYEVVRICHPIAVLLRDAKGATVSRVPLLDRSASAPPSPCAAPRER